MSVGHFFVSTPSQVQARRFSDGEMFAGLASLAGETIAGHCCVEKRAFQAACGHSARFARRSRVARRPILYIAKKRAQLCVFS